MTDSAKIEDLDLPSGGLVSFSSLDDLTGRDLRKLRAARDIEGNGSFYNAMTQTALELLVAEWTIPGKDLRTPMYDKRAADQLSARDLAAIERHLMPHVLKLVGDNEEDSEDRSPGSPSRPVSA
jgi:hypothetical protein